MAEKYDLQKIWEKGKEGFGPGHRTCSGCFIPPIVRTVLGNVPDGYEPVVSIATGCLEVTSTIWPHTSFGVSCIHNAFENSASTLAGVERAYVARQKRGELKKKYKFVVFAGDGGCYVPQTKILTEEGLKNVEDLKIGDKIFSVNPVTLNIEPVPVIKMHIVDYNNLIVKVNHNFVHFDVSLNHNVPVYNKFTKKVDIIKANSLLDYGRSDKINIITGNLNWAGKNKNYFEVPSVSYHKISANKKPFKKILMANWLEFFGYWISEGHISQRSIKREKYGVYIAQTNKKNVDKIKACLSKLPFNFWYSKDRFIISNQQLWSYLKQFGKAKDKFIPKEFKNLPPKQLKFLFDSLILGDGHIDDYKNSKIYRYSTISEKLKNDFIEIALKLGYRVHLDENKRKGRLEYSISASNYKPTMLANLRRKNISSYKYNGKVFCPELKKNHILIIEKDGRISLNMNSVDIGLQALSGMLERGHDILYVLYDNAAYSNTGGQRSGSTPYLASTTTTPAGTVSSGKAQKRKDIMPIVAAHNIPYAAQANPAYLDDFIYKIKKAFSYEGPKFLSVLMPCNYGWKFPSFKTYDVARLATETNFWPLYEIENGKYKITYKPKQVLPVEEYLKSHKLYAHLFKPEFRKDLIAKVQEETDKELKVLTKK